MAEDPESLCDGGSPVRPAITQSNPDGFQANFDQRFIILGNISNEFDSKRNPAFSIPPWPFSYESNLEVDVSHL